MKVKQKMRVAAKEFTDLCVRNKGQASKTESSVKLYRGPQVCAKGSKALA